MEEGAIFPNLGFDTFTSAEYMSEEEDKNPLGWTKDEILTDEIIKCLDSTDRIQIMCIRFPRRDMEPIRKNS
ncbi:MAG: hypothetical protein ACLU6Y_18425 [Ruminococcus sp.]